MSFILMILPQHIIWKSERSARKKWSESIIFKHSPEAAALHVILNVMVLIILTKIIVIFTYFDPYHMCDEPIYNNNSMKNQ